MIWFVLAIIVLIVALGWALLADVKLPAVAFLLVAVGLLGISMTTIVEPRNIGVATTFGKQAEEGLSSGPHLKAPWTKVTDIDGTTKTRKYHGESALDTVIGDGSNAAVSLTLRWRAVGEKAGTIFADFRAEDPIERLGDELVSPTLKSALQNTLGSFNPCGSLKVVKADETGAAALPSFAPDLDAINEQLTSELENEDLFEVVDVLVTYVNVSDSTQKCIDDFTEAVGQTIAAQQNRETSIALAAANAELEGKVSPELNQARCLDALNKAIEAKYPLNAAFNCMGDGGALVVPSTR